MTALDTRLIIPKLEEDGRNWVNYKDHLNMALNTNGHAIHLTSGSTPKDYGGLEHINGTDATERWKRGERYVRQLIVVTIHEPIFNKTKGRICTKDVWEAPKKPYGERSRMTRVELVRKFRSKQ